MTATTTPASDTTTHGPLSVLVVDAPATVQQWLDQYSTALAARLSGTRHGEHGPQTVVVTLPQLWAAIEAHLRNPADTGPWSISESGLPPVPASPASPNPGNWLHNVWHAMGGN